MKQEDKWKVDAGTQWRMPDTALKKTHQVNTGMLEKDLLREDDLKKKKINAHVHSVCWEEIVLNVFITGSFLAKVNPFI